jgi:hypothetical protein
MSDMHWVVYAIYAEHDNKLPWYKRYATMLAIFDGIAAMWLLATL